MYVQSDVLLYGLYFEMFWGSELAESVFNSPY